VGLLCLLLLEPADCWIHWQALLLLAPAKVALPQRLPLIAD
jgi:hypothetical protein